MSESMNKNYIITIGRQLGSGGSAIGKRIADRFGFQYIDKEVFLNWINKIRNIQYSGNYQKMLHLLLPTRFT